MSDVTVAESNDNLDFFSVTDAVASKNSRCTLRFLAKEADVKAFIRFRWLFLRFEVPVTVLDISSRGAAVKSPRKIGVKRQVRLHLTFADGQCFEIDSVVVRIQDAQLCGLKFRRYQPALADYLYHAQSAMDFS